MYFYMYLHKTKIIIIIKEGLKSNYLLMNQNNLILNYKKLFTKLNKKIKFLNDLIKRNEQKN